MLTLAGQNVAGDTPSIDDVADWADHWELTTPVLIDVGEQVSDQLRDDPNAGVPHSENLVGPGNRLVIRDARVDEDDIAAQLD